MTKIHWGDSIATKLPGEPWQSDDPILEKTLNVFAKKENIKGYIQNVEESILKLAEEALPDLEVLEEPSRINYDYPEDTVF